MRAVPVRFKEPNEENLRFLEDLSLSYEEMTNCFDVKLDRFMIYKLFKKYGIKHKKTTTAKIEHILRKRPVLLKENISTLARYFNTSREAVRKAMKNIDRSNN